MDKSDRRFRHAVRNEHIIPLEDAVLHVSTKEVFFNFGVYESVKLLSGVVVFLEDHLHRLFESASRLEIRHSFTREMVTRMISELVTADGLDTATMRIQLIGGMDPIMFIFPQELPVYPDAFYTTGCPAVTYRGERIVPEVKSNALLLNYLAQRSAAVSGAHEALFVDRHDTIPEGSRSNFFAVTGRRLITPKSGVLAGVTRKYILELAETVGLACEFRCPSLQEVLSDSFDELFISSTSMGAMPLSSVDGHRFSGSFPVTAMLHAGVRERETAYVAARLSR